MVRTTMIAALFVFVSMPMISQAEERGEAALVEQFDDELVRGWVSDYFEGTRSMDATTWSSAFAENAVLDDPVGSPLKTTPQDILAQGHSFVSAFAEIGLYEEFVHVVGNEAVAKWEGRGVTNAGEHVSFEGINHFTFNQEGKITTLRGFFSPPASSE